tara:strand:- start:179 stop:361 length:183 start_codon:yes stop_codon:yes gene_type:complete
MLILTRKPNESLILGDNLATFKILGVRGNQVRIGIIADDELTIHREEIYLKIQDEKNLKE